MISACWPEVAPKILARSTLAGRPAPSGWSVIRFVPVARSWMRASTPIFCEMSIAGRNRSTAWPPVLRRIGARSTTVTEKPCLVSQYASTGPAMLAPEMRIRMNMPPFR